MMLRITLALLSLFLISDSVVAQHHVSDYAGQESRTIKSLSDSDINQISNGSGWGLAKIAELNGYPGPRHVLDLQEELALNSDQVESITAIFNAMKSEAIEKGKLFINAEKALEESFQSNEIDDASLEELVTQSAIARSRLRLVHLSAHLQMMDILSEEQIWSYNELRGYDSSDPCENIPAGHNPEMWKQHNNCSED